MLFVEDNEALRKISCKFLESLGFIIISAKDGEDALKKVKKIDFQIDLLVSDIIMPRMGGVELAKHIKDEFPYVKILYISGFNRNSGYIDKLLNKNVEYLVKPFSFDVLINTIETLLNPLNDELNTINN